MLFDIPLFPSCLTGLFAPEVGVWVLPAAPLVAPPELLPLPVEAEASFDCAAICRHLARRFLNQTLKSRKEHGYFHAFGKVDRDLDTTKLDFKLLIFFTYIVWDKMR